MAELTDNSAEDDGYRFHDVMHFALLAKLGWSPVIRKLMGRKRKSDPAVDEIQDGARANIVEELIVKIIHSEGTGLAEGLDGRDDRSMFTNPGLISFGFLKQLPRLASGLEAEGNKLWEWEDAIVAGSKLFEKLRCVGQGTVTIDLEARTIDFHEDVYVDLPGTIVGIGSASFLAADLPEHLKGSLALAGLLGADVALKSAILESLCRDGSSSELQGELDTSFRKYGGVVVRARGAVRCAMWDRRAISFRTTWTVVGNTVTCTAFAMSDPRDAVI